MGDSARQQPLMSADVSFRILLSDISNSTTVCDSIPHSDIAQMKLPRRRIPTGVYRGNLP